METKRYDVVVAGAGPAGRLAALALADRGFEVLLADGAKELGGGQAASEESDGRTTSLAYASLRAFERLGLWPALAEGACAVTDIVVANGQARDRFREGGARGGVLSFSDGLLPSTERWEGRPLAVMVENAALRRVLAAACAAAPGVEERRVGVVGTRTVGGETLVTLTDGSAVRASLVVACDGRRSPLRRRAGIRTRERAFGQDAVTYVVGHDRPHHGVARQAFLRGGPFAALPLSGDRSSIVWTMLARQADAVMAASDEELARLTHDRLGDALGTLSVETAPLRYPLSGLLADSMVADRLVLVGDAGHVVHPIAGQGFNLSVRDAASLADVLAEARDTGLDVGHGAVLAEYDRWRRADVTTMSVGTGALAGLLSTGEGVTRVVTGAGFGLVQRLGGVRARLAREAGGDAGRLPSLMAG